MNLQVAGAAAFTLWASAMARGGASATCSNAQMAGEIDPFTLGWGVRHALDRLPVLPSATRTLGIPLEQSRCRTSYRIASRRFRFSSSRYPSGLNSADVAPGPLDSRPPLCQVQSATFHDEHGCARLEKRQLKQPFRHRCCCDIAGRRRGAGRRSRSTRWMALSINQRQISAANHRVAATGSH